MANDSLNGSATASSELNTLKLSEHDGFIDLEILIDIHKCLSESKFEDDRTLSTWVKANYLQEPIKLPEEKSRLIRNSEGFLKLDKAYRRARTLTGKAQDKWPFLDKSWRKLSSTFIKNKIHGDAAMSVARTEPSGAVRDTPMSNGLDGHREYDSKTPRSQASLSAANLSRHLAQEMKSPLPPDRSLRQQEAERKGHHQGTPSLDGTTNGTPQDAGFGKVRGPDGRYVNKDNPTPPAMKRPNIKYVKNSRTRAALEGESEEIPESSDEEVEETKGVSRRDHIASESGREASQDVPKAAVNASSAAAGITTTTTTTTTTTGNFQASAILAAEAEAVPSNLDRLPTGFYAHKKRKSEFGIQRGGSKRGRGSRGGILGRPRKSETVPDREKLESEEAENLAVEDSTPQSWSPASIPARRSSRKSAVLALETSTPWDPTGDVLFGGASQKQPSRREVDAPKNGISKTFDSSKTITPSKANQKPRSAAQAVNGGSSSTLAKSSTTSARPGNSTSSNKRVSFSPEIRDQPGNIMFFARVTTVVGDQEVRLLEEDLTHEVDLVKKYAQWLYDGKASVDFDTFKQIFKLSRDS